MVLWNLPVTVLFINLQFKHIFRLYINYGDRCIYDDLFLKVYKH